jgi:hypothetical protein
MWLLAVRSRYGWGSVATACCRAVDEQAAAAGGAPVEPARELVEVAVELVDRVPVVEGAGESALEQRRGPVHARQGDMGGLAGGWRLIIGADRVAGRDAAERPPPKARSTACVRSTPRSTA